MIGDNVWSYTGFLWCLLILYVWYLILPKAFRRQFCRAHRRRYTRRKEFSSPMGGYWLPSSSAAAAVAVNVNTNVNAQIPSSSWPKTGGGGGGRDDDDDDDPWPKGQPQQQHAPQRLQQSQSTPRPPPQDPRLLSQWPNSAVVGGSGGHQSQQQHQQHQQRTIMNTATPPSPEHPALKKIPPNKIIAETMGRLQGRGIRLMAHGVQCDPKRVWIRLEEEEEEEFFEVGEQQQLQRLQRRRRESSSVTWQTEFPRRVPNSNGDISIVLMRGSLHKIALCNVLYIDVGKKTKALLRPEHSTTVQENTCFSLLTQNGSLDLQANSKLERDSLVACFSMILDDVHSDVDWRALYEASPDPSMAAAATTTTNEEGTEVAYLSDLMVEV
jgi:hypothetical protein